MDPASGNVKAVRCSLEKDHGQAGSHGQYKLPDRRACVPHSEPEPGVDDLNVLLKLVNYRL